MTDETDLYRILNHQGTKLLTEHSRIYLKDKVSIEINWENTRFYFV